MAEDWQKLARVHEASSIALAKRVEELTTPKTHTAGGMIEHEGQLHNIEYHYTEQSGPNVRIMEAIKELEEDGYYVTFRAEYDSPLKK